MQQRTPAHLPPGKLPHVNLNDKLADKDGKLFDGMTEDGLHLSNQGYQVWADAMRPILIEWLGPPPTSAPASSGSDERR